MALAVVAVSGSAIAAYEVARITSTFSDNAVSIGETAAPAPPPFLGAFEGGFTMLVVGTDNDADQGPEFGERDGVRNDVNILVHVSGDHRNAVAVSIPRDLVIAHPECDDPETGEHFDAMNAQPLNQAYARGGLGCAVATVSNLTGVPIQYAAATSFNGVIAMTDAVGGVEVCLTEPIFEPDSGVDLPEGWSTVQGRTALAFLRNRHGVGDGSDLSRIGVQQQYLASLLRKIRSDSTLSDPLKLYSLAQAVSQNIIPSRQLGSPDSMVSLALTLKDVQLDRVVFVQYPVTAYIEDPNKVQPLEPVADELFSRILADLPFDLPNDATAAGSSLAPEQNTASTDATASAAPDGTATTTDGEPLVLDGLTGQTAAQQTCASGFSG